MNYRVEQLRYLLREDPSSRVFYQLAEVLRKQGQVTDAVEVLHSGLAHHPRYVAAWVSLGRAHLELEDLPQAQRAFERALELDPQNAVAAKLIGETALAREDWPRAARAFRLARELAPADDTLGARLEMVEERLAAVAGPAPVTAPIRVRPAVVRVSGEEPFSVPGHGDTGVWQSTQEVFAAMSAPASASASESDSAPAPGTPSPLPSVDDLRAGLLAGFADDAWEGADEEEDGHDDEELPLPTLTLARLAAEQGDLELAERTLESLLDRDPVHPDAGRLLDEVRDRRRQAARTDPAAALRLWLDGIRLAAERLSR